MHGGSYATTDYFFNATDVPKWNAELALFKNIEREGKAVLALDKPISVLLDKEFGIHLLWYTTKLKSSQGLKPANIAK